MASVDFVISNKVKKLEKDMKTIPTKLQSLFEKEWEKSINDTIYSTPEGNSYERTMGMISSITSETYSDSSGIYVSVFNDYLKLPYVAFESHSSWVTGEDVRGLIPEFLARGHKGIVHYSPTNYDELTYLRLVSQKKYLKIIKRELKSKGYRVK